MPPGWDLRGVQREALEHADHGGALTITTAKADHTMALLEPACAGPAEGRSISPP